MAKKRTKKANRIFSYLCISVFALSLVCCIGFIIAVINQKLEHQKLLIKQEEITNEYNYLKDLYDNNVDEDGYYNVYTDGEMIIYGVGNTIEISE